ncbi:MAG: hypothetical protein C4K60_11535 [Ideonella sp. MAG2]|nr:MAG: hypothetical protein C4K60_11535 [Ideonella sp. MAG2]
MPTSFSASSEVVASCFCGAATLTVPLPLRPPIHCHCSQCRRLSGAAWTTWVSVPRPAVSIQGQDALRSFAATPNVLRHFCGQCGTHVYTADARMPQVLGIPAGILPPDSVTKAKCHYFVSDKAHWATLPEGEPCFGGPTGTEALSA